MARKSLSNQKTKKDIMVEILRDAILSGELQPGERLLQEELAERFNVSSTPVREAIQQLIAEGVLSHSPYRGVEVAEVRLENTREIYLIRSVVEALAVRLGVPNLKISEVQHLHTLHHQMAFSVKQADYRPLLRLNREFHMLIYQAATAPTLYQIIKTLWIKSPWDTLFVVPHRPQMVIEEHQHILDAIDAGDAVQAGHFMQQHIERGSAALAKYLELENQN